MFVSNSFTIKVIVFSALIDGIAQWEFNHLDLFKSIASSFGLPDDLTDITDFLRDSYTNVDSKSMHQEYDFVIVGAGSAGSVIAKRLSDDPGTTVLLLEAGKPEMILNDIPLLTSMMLSTEYVWEYYLERQPGVCKGAKNGRCFWPRGKAVGGSSVVNYMMYTRGRPEEWDRIAADGNYGWSFKEVLQYFMKSEKAQLEGYDKDWHRNRDGVLPVEFVPVKTKLLEVFLKAAELLGNPILDYNAPGPLGFGAVQGTISNGRRQSAAKVFLRKHRNRRNLHILPESHVSKLLINSLNNTAYGVEYYRKGQKQTVRSRKEVIVSAGPIASPQLLMLSGIGPREHLAEMDIPIIKDLPVGKTLYDHLCFSGTIYTLKNPNNTRLSLSESDIDLRSIVSWLRDGDDLLSSLGGVEGLGYIKVPHSDEPAGIPDVELISIGGSIVSDGGPTGSKAVRKSNRLKDNEFDEAFGKIDDKDTWSTLVMLTHPKSKGKIELRNKNPFTHPKIYANYLTDQRDVKTMLAGIRYTQALAATAPFQELGAQIHRASYPGCRGLQFDSDAYWECALRTLASTLYHPVGSCRMGPAGDAAAVVDPELRVRGLRRLRVDDSSVIPRTISAHTNAPAIMIGEKLADLVKSTWHLR